LVDDPTKTEKSQSDEQSKSRRSFTLALVVVVPFMIYFGIVLLYFKDAVLLEKMTALLGGFVAAVLGYYFGQRPVQNLTQQLSRATAEKEETKRRAEEAVDTANSDVNSLNEELENIKRLLGLKEQ
jgi:uncharacterized protein HemX